MLELYQLQFNTSYSCHVTTWSLLIHARARMAIKQPLFNVAGQQSIHSNKINGRSNILMLLIVVELHPIAPFSRFLLYCQDKSLTIV